MTAMDSPARPIVTDATERERYEAQVDGELVGVLRYAIRRGRLALIHTEVSPAHEGKGVGSSLVRFALDDARRRRLGVIAVCPYVQEYLTRHPEDDDIVVGRGPAAS
jgi:predicted GNAT family acetyltransferase